MATVAMKPNKPTPLSDVEAARTEAMAAVVEPVEPAPGRVLGDRYLLKREIGVGGFGAVFEAEDERLHKRVAVKILSPQLSQHDEQLERFRREAIAASQVGHDGIVDVTDFDRCADGTPFIVMEYLHGSDLADLLARQRPMPIPRALRIAAEVAFAVDAAHRKQIVHRDLKPANIYLVEHESGRDMVKVLDFGISKMMSTAQPVAGSLTARGTVLGTPYYMAPEQARGDADIDHRVDVYALGIILYAMVAGQPPFVGDAYMTVVTQHVRDAPQPPSVLCEDIAEVAGLDEVILKAIAKEPGDRFGSMRDFGDRLIELLAVIDPESAAVSGIRTPTVPPGTQPALAAAPTNAPSLAAVERRERTWKWLALSGVLLAAGVIAFVSLGGSKASTQKTASTPVPANADAAAGRLVELRSPVDGAEVLNEAGELLGSVPLRVRVPPTAAGIAVYVRARGYLYRRVRLHRDTQSPLRVNLDSLSSQRWYGPPPPELFGPPGAPPTEAAIGAAPPPWMSAETAKN